MKWPTKLLGDICSKVTDGSHNPPKNQDHNTGYPMLSSKNVKNNYLSFDNARFISGDDFKKENKRTDVVSGDVLLTIVGTIGRALVVLENHPKLTLQRSVAVLKPSPLILSFYLYYVLSSDNVQCLLQRSSKGVAQKGIYLKDVKQIPIPLPPLEEQHRIVDLLDRAQALIDKRKEQIKLMDQLVQSLFYEMFGDPVTNPKGWEETELSCVADIKSGVTKGRKFGDKETVEVPYMRVANVQDGHIVLDDVSQIKVLTNEIEKYQLQKDDLLLTEGGDPDKLGRGAIWKGEIKPCIHQNHVFRVRLIGDKLKPEYISLLIGSQKGKRYFFKSAKQTTGIASINMTQLKKCPILNPPIDLQNTFAERVQKIEAQKQAMTNSLKELQDNFNSLSQRAFKGEL